MSVDGTVIKQNISKNIVKYRELAGLSQKELAKRLDVTPSRISNWEQGANCPTIDILFEVCKILNVSINDIYGVYTDSNIPLSSFESSATILTLLPASYFPLPVPPSTVNSYCLFTYSAAI